jgi:hypothetical protein
MRKIELSPQYYRPPWTEIDQSKFDFELCTIQRGSNNRRFQAETTRLLDEKYRLHIKAYTDGSKKEEKVGYAVVLPERTIKRRQLPQNSIYNVEQSARKCKEKTVIITDSLSTMMAVLDRKRSKNPKTQTIRKLMD